MQIPPDFSRKDRSVPLCANILIVASPRYAEAADWDSSRDSLPGLVVLPLDPAEPVPADAAGAASLAIVEVDPAERASSARIKALKAQFPDLPLIAAIADASVSLVRTLVREGVADVVALPLSFDEVVETSVNVLARSRDAMDLHRVLAPMVAVVRSIGGCGATSIATHLAAELAESGRSTALVDLDIQSGSAAEYLDTRGRGSVIDLIEADHRLDEDLIRSAARQVSANLAVFAAPDAIRPLESIDAEQLLRALAELQGHYGSVVLDLPANWTNWTLSAVSAADLVLLVVEPTIASLRQAKRIVELFDTVGIEARRVQLVLNRVERKLFKAIGADDVADTLKRPVMATVTLEPTVLGTAQDQGLLAGQANKRSRFAADLRGLSEAVVARLPAGQF